MNRILHVIVNPVAGGGQCGRRWPRLAHSIRSQGIDVQVYQTQRPGQATDLARQVLRDGGAELAVVGGDGTINEAVNGWFDDGRPINPDAVLSIIPCGTGSDFARNLGIGTFERALQGLSHGIPRAIDLGVMRYRLNGRQLCRYFVNSADVGYGAEAAAWVNRTSKQAGRLSYLIGGIRTILTVPVRPAQVEVDGKAVHDGPLGMIILANGRFHAGGMLFAPEARLDDGLFDVLLIGDVPRWRLLSSLFPRVYRGTLIGSEGVVHLRGQTVRVSSVHRLPFEVDGEQPGTTDLRALVLPGGLRVRMCPEHH